MTPGQRGRRYAKAEFAVAVLYLLCAALLYVIQPATSQPMSYDTSYGTALFLIAVASVVVGFAWMIRIYREKPEPDHRAWRYRSRR